MIAPLAHRAALLRILLLMPLLLAPAVPPAAAAQERGDAPATWKINLKEADIRELVTQVATITGGTFVVDQRVKGKVTVISSASLDAEGVYQLFLSVLRVHGFAAVRTGNVTKIVLQTVAKQSASPNDLRAPTSTSEEIVTQVIPAENVAATELVKILRPMIPQHGHIAAVANPNVVIVSDHSENLARMLEIVKRIDVADRDEIVVVPLKEAWVGDVAELLAEMVPQAAGNRQQAGSPNAITMIANERNNSLVLKGKAGKIAEVMDLIARLDLPSTTGGSTQVIPLSHADANSVAEIIKGVVTGGEPGAQGNAAAQGQVTIQADESNNAIVVRADPGTMADIRQLIEQLDLRRTQVLIEAAIVEVSLDDTKTYGVDFAAVDRSGTVPVISVPLAGSLGAVLSGLAGGTDGNGNAVAEDAGLLTAAGSATSPTFAVGKIDPNGLSFLALIQALATTAGADLLSTPSILTLDNEEAKIVVGQNVPFRTGSFTTNTSGSNNPFTTIQREDVGLTLTVTPHVHDGQVVRLEIQQEVSNVVNSAVGDSGFADIVTSQRTIETTILADDRQTIVLGGLIQDDINVSNSRVPLLGDIPGLGRLFRSDRTTRTKRNLLVFLRPTVLRTDEEVATVTAEKYSRIWQVRKSDGRPGNLRHDVDGLYDGRERPEDEQD